MNDFLREYLGMTGTKFGCGAAQCLSCAVIVDNPDGTSYTSPTCVVPAASFDGKSIRTVEGHAKNGELSVLQKAFIDAFRVPVRLLHRRFPERGPGSARAAGEEAGGAGRPREDHRRGARRPPVPLHRLHQIPRGRARRDPGRSGTLSVLALIACNDVPAIGFAQGRRAEQGGSRECSSTCGFNSSSRSLALPDERAGGVRRFRQPRRTVSRAPKAFHRSATRRPGRRRYSPSSARC